MQIWSLSSGSSGNCYLVKDGETLVLLECGLRITRVRQELSLLGFSASQLSAVLATHEHVDHWISALAIARRYGVPLICSQGTLASAGEVPSNLDFLQAQPGREIAVGSLRIAPFTLPHDAAEPVGFFISSDSASICLATDLGRPAEEAIERAREADLAIIEANHDVEMLRKGPYPSHLKARILSDRGHLSNDDCGRAILQMAQGRPRRFWLAHLSHTNNTHTAALSSVRSLLRKNGLDHLQVEVAVRDRRSLYWDSETALSQLPLF